MPSTPVVVLDSTLTDIADAIRGKNGSSDTYKPSEMSAAITAIPSGGGGGIPREANASGVYGAPTSQSFTFSLPSNATDVADFALNYAFYNSTALTSADLSSLTAITGDTALSNAFSGCTALTSVDLGSLTTLSGSNSLSNAFRGCTSLASADLSSLATVSAGNAISNAFLGCTSLTSINLGSLAAVGGSFAFSNTFYGCTSLASADLSSLANVNGYGAFNSIFSGCTSLTSLSFPALTTSSFGTFTNQFDNMLKNVTGCTVHFPAAIQSTIGSWASVTNGFGGTNTTVLFDL